MILDTIFRLLYLVLWLFDVALVIYVLMSWKCCARSLSPY